MTYETVKKLKEAGFPQYNHYYVKEDGIVSDVCIPTLSELIEACGKIPFTTKYTDDGRIYAKFDIEDIHGNKLDFWMYSFEDIFAYLWLAINKK